MGEGCLLVPVGVLSSPDPVGPHGGDETDLATSRGAPLDRERLTNVLVVTAAVGMLNGVHGYAAQLGPAVALGLVLVVDVPGLQDRLVDSATATAGDNANYRRGDDLLGAGGQLDPGPLGIRVVGEYCGAVAGGPGELATVARLLLQVGTIH